MKKVLLFSALTSSLFCACLSHGPCTEENGYAEAMLLIQDFGAIESTINNNIDTHITTQESGTTIGSQLISSKKLSLINIPLTFKLDSKLALKVALPIIYNDFYACCYGTVMERYSGIFWSN